MTKKAAKRVYLPALKGRIGDWAYYTTLMKFSEVKKHVKLTTEFYTNTKLSDMVQRAVKSDRTSKIADYLLRENERFFSSMVVAVFKGAPDWHEFSISAGSTSSGIEIGDLDISKTDSFGFLSLSGEEILFPLDGQHRLSGIIEALGRDDESVIDLQDDELSVIMIAHDPSVVGRTRSRRLFTTLNKRAVPVKKSETIALDEDDVMAIAARYLVEDHEELSKPGMVAIRSNAAMPPTDTKSLTTIVTLYDLLTRLFKELSGQSLEALKYNRPDDEWLDVYLACATEFFAAIGENFSIFGKCLDAKEHSKIVRKQRHKGGGHILFRPAGLLLFGELVAAHIKENWEGSFEDEDEDCGKMQKASIKQIRASVSAFQEIETDLSEAPYADLLFIQKTGKMVPSGRPLVRDILLYDFDMLSDRKLNGVQTRLAAAIGKEITLDEFLGYD